MSVERTGILSVDILSVGGLATKATFGEMTTRSLDGCKTVDGVMGMGLSSFGDDKNVFEKLVDVSVNSMPPPSSLCRKEVACLSLSMPYGLE